MSQPAPFQPTPVPEPASHAVLVIDDEAAVRNVTRALLERAGYRVLTAASGKEGLALYAEHASTIGLVVLDLSMPRMSGTDVLLELRRIGGSALRVVLASGYANPDTPSGGPNIAGFLQKPFRFDELLSTVREASK